jgi:hypothetical protein
VQYKVEPGQAPRHFHRFCRLHLVVYVITDHQLEGGAKGHGWNIPWGGGPVKAQGRCLLSLALRRRDRHASAETRTVRMA